MIPDHLTSPNNPSLVLALGFVAELEHAAFEGTERTPPLSVAMLIFVTIVDKLKYF